MASDERPYEFSLEKEGGNDENGAVKHGDVSRSESAVAPIPGSSKEDPKPQQLTLQALADRALHFVSTASNETLGACLVGLGATTYIVLGRVGLVLIGVVGGIALHASWDGTIRGPGSEQEKAQEEKRRKEIGLDVAHRVLDWRDKAKAEGKEDGKVTARVRTGSLSERELSYAGFKPETASALKGFTDAVIRDYVR